MSELEQDLRRRLETLRAAYVESLPRRLRAVEEDWLQLDHDPQPAQQASMERRVRQLADSAALFGYAQLAGTARDLAQLLEGQAQAGIPRGRGRAQIRALVACLDQALTSPDAHAVALELDGVRRFEPRQRQRILLALEDPISLERLVRRVEDSDHEARTLDRWGTVADAVALTDPDVVVADLNLLGDYQPGDSGPALVGLATGHDIHTRLEAVRRGCRGFLPHPLDPDALLERLESLTPTPATPHRILLVCDCAEVAWYYTLVLERSGMQVCTADEPWQIIETLLSFAPDLVLMDETLSDCSGKELATVVRQQEAFDGLPVVLLTQEDAPVAGWDTLPKPLSPIRLLQAVRERLRPSRATPWTASYDPLTGLLSHSLLLERLEMEVARSQRHGYPLGFAHIDLDGCRQINEELGYLVGDQVIRRLGRALCQRLRRTDCLGRFGGDELGVILVGTEDPATVLERACQSFAELSHTSGNVSLRATFSAGVATFPRYEDTNALTLAATRALIKAKAGGGNQVMLDDQ